MTHGYPHYLNRVPNHRKLIQPGSIDMQDSIGHVNPGGGGSRNAFGRDFRLYGRSWTKGLCEKDSDGDGVSNGMELGDPECVWQYDPQNPQTPSRTDYITFPGDGTSKPPEFIVNPTPAPTPNPTPAPTSVPNNNNNNIPADRPQPGLKPASPASGGVTPQPTAALLGPLDDSSDSVESMGGDSSDSDSAGGSSSK